MLMVYLEQVLQEVLGKIIEHNQCVHVNPDHIHVMSNHLSWLHRLVAPVQFVKGENMLESQYPTSKMMLMKQDAADDAFSLDILESLMKTVRIAWDATL